MENANLDSIKQNLISIVIENSSSLTTMIKRCADVEEGKMENEQEENEEER